jgi:cholesterol transport system auxiliary component
MNRHLPIVAALALVAPLSGCISFGEKPPAQLMSLSSDAKLTGGDTHVATDKQAISVAVPVSVSALRNQRIAVLTGGTAYAYLPKALWSDVPAALLRNVLAETIEAKTGRFVPDQRNANITPDTRLGGTLVAFQLIGGEGKVQVIFDATLAKSGSEEIRTRRFEATAPAGSEKPDAVTAALNRAANQVATDVAGWIAG